MLDEISKKTLVILFSLTILCSLVAMTISVLALRKNTNPAANAATNTANSANTNKDKNAPSATTDQNVKPLYGVAVPDQSQGFTGLATSSDVKSISASEKSIVIRGIWTADANPNTIFLGTIDGNKIASKTLQIQAITIDKNTKIVKYLQLKKGDKPTKAQAQGQTISFDDFKSIENLNGPIQIVFADKIDTKSGQPQLGQKLVASQLIFLSSSPTN